MIASIAVAADGPPTENLTFGAVSFWAGDIPRCSDIGRKRTICTWHMPNHEYFTCIVREGAAALDHDECVFEKLANRRHKFLAVNTRYPDEAHRRNHKTFWDRHLAKVEPEIGVGSNLIRVTKMVGFGPLRCESIANLICVWETDDRSPGHADSLKYLASGSLEESNHGNARVRLLCEFEESTLEGTQRACIANYLLS